MRSGGAVRLAWIAWAVVLTIGFLVLARYESTPGAEASPPTEWPTSTGIPRAAGGRATLVLFVHPKCPCSRATLKELAVALEHHAGEVEARVLFVRPPGVEAGWERTKLWDQASDTRGAQSLPDEEGREATRFGVKTSGQVLLFGPDGRLRFSGGITAARGHEGDNAGLSALETGLREATGPVVRTPVFGCPLLATARAQRKDE